MFSSKGLFSAFQCPRTDECLLPACWFSHDSITQPDIAEEYDPFTAGVPESPPAKRRKLHAVPDDSPAAMPSSTSRVVTPPSSEKLDAKATRSVAAVAQPIRNVSSLQNDNENELCHQSDELAQGAPGIKPSVGGQQQQLKDTAVSAPNGKPGPRPAEKLNESRVTPTSMQRPVTPPSISSNKTASVASDVKQEVLRPRILAKGPDWQSRDTLLKVLHKNLVMRNNDTIKKVKQGEKDLSVVRLMPSEVIALALDEEVDLAKKYGPGVYQNVMKQRIHAITKLSDEQWKQLVKDRNPRISNLICKRSEGGRNSEAATVKNHKNVEVIPGLDRYQEIQILAQLQQPLENLQQYGYVTHPPTPDDIRGANDTLKASDGWEKCDRCSSRFQVFPGRNDEGSLTSGGRCCYHWGRAGTGLLNRLDRSTGGKEARFSCCGQSVGSDGCTEADVHVFNDKDPKRLAAVWQWQETPEKEGVARPVSFDCEMCYTTLGMEVVRVTAVSWPHNETLLDILVRPYGEILDLNTRFSGVSRKMYAEALSYTITEDSKSESISKVDSPEAARQLIFDLLTPNTPLIGHAIDNDLNTLRIIHPFVIDTVLLYPHRRGLPMRNSLRGLAFEHLDGRSIQTAAEKGHDSKEDAIATSDLVTKAVRVKWSNLRADGWQFVDGKLMKGGDADSKL